MAEVYQPTSNSYRAIMEEAKHFATRDIQQSIMLYSKLLEYFSSILLNNTLPSSDKSVIADIQSFSSFPDQSTAFPSTSNDNSTNLISSETAPLENSDTLTEEEVFRIQEQTLIALSQLYAKSGESESIRNLLKVGLPLFQVLPKARTAKIVRILLDSAAMIPYSFKAQEELCKDCIDWCIKEKRTFLRLRVETRLVQLYYLQSKFQLGLQHVEALLKEVKKLDDKLLLVEIHLIQSKLYFTINNISRSKASLTAARTTANAINCPPSLQGDIDLQTGMLHVQEKDAHTAFSYFLEAFNAFSSTSASPSSSANTFIELQIPPSSTASVISPSSTPVPSDEIKSLQSFQYMLLTKIILGKPDDVFVLISGKHGLRYAGYSVLEPYKAISRFYKERSLKKFESVLSDYESSFIEDKFLNYHVHQLYDTFLEQNLQRVLEPYNKVEIEYCAKLIDLPQERVEAKLSEMILDGKLNATLDQRGGQIILFEKHELPSFYQDVLDTIENMEQVITTLYAKAKIK